MRKPNMPFDNIVNYINSKPIGSNYTVAELHRAVNTGASQRCCTVNMTLRECGCVERVKRGTYKILHRIPDFVDSTTFEANRGYTESVFTNVPQGTPNSYQRRYEGTYYTVSYVPRGLKWKVGQPDPRLLESVGIDAEAEMNKKLETPNRKSTRLNSSHR